MEISQLLADMVEMGASDLFLSVGATPFLKIEGRLQPHGDEIVDSPMMHQLVYSIMSDEQKSSFDATKELNMALRVKGTGRFRINVFVQQSEPALVARHVVKNIPSIETLGLPEILKKFVMEERGLVLVVGGTGTGKSTTLASMLDYRNQNRTGHILTIEDPIEFEHQHKKSLVNQREVGIDTESYASALKNAMREAPDVILIGEVRDMDTMKSAIAYSETGHLCLTTLHASNANQAIDRILNFFNEAAYKQLQQDLSQHLRAIVSQRLARGIDGKRVPVIEVMVMTPYIQDLIAQGKHDEIRPAMVQARAQGCQMYDDELFRLVREGKISMDEAMINADSRNNLALRFRLEGVTSRQPKDTQGKEPTKKDISYSRSAHFTDYHTYRLSPVRISPEYADRVPLLEKALRYALGKKGLREESIGDADIDVQYVFSARKKDGLRLQGIENPVSSLIDVHNDETVGSLVINIVDVDTQKAVWRVTTARTLEENVPTQNAINDEVVVLLAEYPPVH